MSSLVTNTKKPKGDEENLNHNAEEDNSMEEQEEALVALIEHRTKEVDHLKQRIAYYKKQLAEAEKRLQDSEIKLACFRGQNSGVSSRGSQVNRTKNVKEERTPKSPRNSNAEGPTRNPPQSRKELVIPGDNVRTKNISVVKVKAEKSRSGHEAESSGNRDRGTKRKFEQKEHKELIRSIGKSSSLCPIKCHASNQISSQHKRKLRSLILCPANAQLFITSALDGVVSLWQLQTGRLAASLLSTTDCVSAKQRRWPEDIAWHPNGNSLFAVYTADAGDSQISILNLNKTQGRARVTFLEDKPHVKGIINSIMFMPREDTCFVTGGSDHAVVLWREEDEENQWKPKFLHRNLHSAAVTGVAGMRHKNVVLSVGADKRIYGYDLQVGRADYKHQVEYKCMSVLPNPCDFNLFMVQSGQPEKQLGLYDIRLRHTELHSFGWKQDSSESQSALINQSWSPDGLYITSGSADPVIHIFDIRYNVHRPSQSIRAHQKRVFKAEWHYAQPLLISISSDLNIGLHKVS